MIRNLCTVRAQCSGLLMVRAFSSDIDYSHEKPAHEQLEHVQKRVLATVPLMFRQRLDYTFYRKDIFCDDQIFNKQIQGLDEYMRYLGKLSIAGQICAPHIEMETVSVVPFIDDGTVRCRWRIKYVSWIRLLLNWRLFQRSYRFKNLSWFDGYSILTVDGNGNVSKITFQKMMQDESKLLNDQETTADRLKKKIAVLRPPVNGAVNFVKRDDVEKEEKS